MVIQAVKNQIPPRIAAGMTEFGTFARDSADQSLSGTSGKAITVAQLLDNIRKSAILQLKEHHEFDERR
jgi:hypothetical protein